MPDNPVSPDEDQSMALFLGDSPIEVTVTFSPHFADIMRAGMVAFGTASEDEVLAMGNDELVRAMFGGGIQTAPVGTSDDQADTDNT